MITDHILKKMDPFSLIYGRLEWPFSLHFIVADSKTHYPFRDYIFNFLSIFSQPVFGFLLTSFQLFLDFSTYSQLRLHFFHYSHFFISFLILDYISFLHLLRLKK